MKKLRDVVSSITPNNKDFLKQAKERLDSLTKPLGSLGVLEDVIMKYCACASTIKPSSAKKTIFIFAGDHGITEEKVSAYPREVTLQMMSNFTSGGACISVLARHTGADIVLVDCGVDGNIDDERVLDKKIAKGTKNFLKSPAMSRDEAVRAFLAGIEAVNEKAKDADLICVGDMGIGNTTSSSAIISLITGRTAAEVTGRGTMIDDSSLKRKIMVIEQALFLHKPDPEDPIGILSKIGGFEIGGIAGAILAAAALKKPVIVDGLITTAALLLAYKFNPSVVDFVFAGHNSLEKGHRIALDYLGLRPLIDLDLRLGEGSGAALASGVLDASLKIFNEMATFSEAGVSEKNE